MFDSIDLNQLTTDHVIPWAINIALALTIFIIGRMVVKMLVNVITKLLERSKMDSMLIHFITSIANSILVLFVIIAALDQLGVDTTSLIALIGAAGLAIGLALQNSMQNFASGVLLVIFRPFKTGDFVEAGGATGVVENISLFSTLIRTGDNREVVIPNGAIYSGNITNYSACPTRRIDMVFGIGYNDDIRKAKDLLIQILSSHDKILKDPEPLVAVGELADSSVNFNVRPWVNSDDYWAVKFELMEKIKLAFDESGISIPFPQMDVHLDKAE